MYKQIKIENIHLNSRSCDFTNVFYYLKSSNVLVLSARLLSNLIIFFSIFARKETATNA